MSDFKLMAVEVALRRLVTQGHFSICAIDNVIAALGIAPPKSLYAELRLLHCVDYGDMPSELLEALPDKLMQLLDCPRMDASRINVVTSGNTLQLVKHP